MARRACRPWRRASGRARRRGGHRSAGGPLVASAPTLLAGGSLGGPADRGSRGGEPVNALFAVARAIERVMAFKLPSRAVAVIDPEPEAGGAPWPPLLAAQRAP